MIKSTSLPTGIIEETTIQTFDKDIEAGDIMLMCSDGILDSNIEYKNKELWIKYMLEDVETSNTQKIADLILNEAIDNNYGVAKDDMSIIVCKFRKKKNKILELNILNQHRGRIFLCESFLIFYKFSHANKFAEKCSNLEKNGLTNYKGWYKINVKLQKIQNIIENSNKYFI